MGLKRLERESNYFSSGVSISHYLLSLKQNKEMYFEYLKRL
jgi:hypothetical protein